MQHMACNLGALRRVPSWRRAANNAHRATRVAPARLRCPPVSAVLNSISESHAAKEETKGTKADKADKAVEGLKQRVKELEEKVELLEGQMSQLSDQTRDRAVALMEALQDPSTDDMQQLLTQGVLEEKTDLDDVLTNFAEVMSRGYLEAVEKLRDRLLVTEWELQAKPLAMRKGVADFESYCAEHRVEGITFEVLSALYEDPTDLEPISDNHLRLMARSLINKAVLAEQAKVYAQCTDHARTLADKLKSDDFLESVSKFLPHVGSNGVFSALKAVAGPAVKAVIPGGAAAATVGMGLAGATLAAAAVAGAVKAMKNDDDEEEGEREREREGKGQEG